MDALHVMNFPTEVWSRILSWSVELRDSTEVPDLESDGAFKCDMPAVSSGTKKRRTATRRSTVLVCRQWNALATPLLYEHVSISDSGQYRQLLRTLKQTSSHGRPGVGHLVKRLDMVAEVPEGFRIDFVVRLCQRMPNLLTLLVQIDGFVRPFSLLNTLPRGLTHLYWMDAPLYSRTRGSALRPMTSFQISIAELGKFMDAHQSLSSLSLPFAIAPSTLHTGTRHQWPSIKEWTFQHPSQLSTLASEIPTTALPNLRMVRVKSRAASELHFSALELKQFLSTHGERLTSIHLPHYYDIWAMSNLCPSVDNLEVAFDWCDSRPDYIPGPGWVRNYRMEQIKTLSLRLRFFPSCPSSARTEHLHRIVAAPWTKVFPRLEKIRVLEEVDVETYRAQDGVTRACLDAPGRWATQPIRVEDIRGQLLGQFTKGICKLVAS